MNGPTFGCANSVSIATRRLASGLALACAGIVTPRKNFSEVLWNCAYPCIGRMSRFGSGVPPKNRVFDVSGPAQEKPVNTRASPLTSTFV